MAEYRLARRVGEVADRLDRMQSLNTRSFYWLTGTAVGLGLLAGNSWIFTPSLPAWLNVSLGALLLVVGWVASRRRRRTLHDAAVAIEERWPDLDSRLVTAIDQQPDTDAGGFNYLQHAVITETLLHSHRHDWESVVSSAAMNRARLQHLVSLLMLVAAFVGAIRVGMAKSDLDREAALAGDVEQGGSEYAITVDPGDVEIERGTSLIVMARFDGRTPEDVNLQITDASGQMSTQPLSKGLDDPLFGCHLARVESDMSYHVTFDGHDSNAYQITVFDFPRLEQADAAIVHPPYTGLGESAIEDVRRLSVIEGSTVTLTCRFNKPVQYAVLQGDETSSLELSPVPVAESEAGLVWNVSLTPQEKQTFRLEIVDDAGRENREPPEFVIDVIPNQPPELAVKFPGRDVRISPLEEMAIVADAQDDFGLQEVGLIYQLPGSEEQSLKLGAHSDAHASLAVAHQLAMEEIEALPNELVAYYLYADDIGPDGAKRRTFSDMYFAEVRHFDEEFREVTSPQGEGANQGAGSPTQKLMELQRDVVNAIWKLIRREWDADQNAEYADDVLAVAEGEQQAIELATELAGTLEDALSKQYVAEAIEQMSLAHEHLLTGAESGTPDQLRPARTAAYDAYQELFKLQTREHQVSRSQSSQSSASASSSENLDRQLEQLDLKNDRSRYETEQQEQPTADQEQLQVLNRLRELARRQNGLNEKIQELENALRAAEADQEREEIERQLKRLREEQQELMRDLEELQERMNNEQNRSRLADARAQAQDVRENLRRTSEALKEGQLSRALASGTRAERELEEMKDELREQTAGQFADTMRELRDEAQKLTEQQQQLGKDLAQESPPATDGPPQLKAEDSADDLQQRIAGQSGQLGELMEELKEVVEQSELSEPLLSKTLYDAVRNTRVDRPEEALQMTGQFLRHGMKREAARAEAQARQGIEQLQAGIEQAAQSVLGNEVEALRRARAELTELSEAIGNELAQADREFSNPFDPEERSSQSGQPPESGGQAPTSPNGKPPSNPNSESGQPGETPPSSPTEDDVPGTSQGTGSPTESDSRSRALSNFLSTANSDPNGGAPSSGGNTQPLTGADFVNWSDRMRNVEEMVDDPELRAEIAQIRDRAKQVRIDLKRHSKSPNWQLVRTRIYGPMLELQLRLAEEIARREPNDDVVPLDRDPVPERYTDLVERYYERLGSGR